MAGGGQSGFGVRVEGVREARSSLDQLGQEAGDNAGKVSDDLAKDLRSKAQRRAHSVGGVAAKAAPALAVESGQGTGAALALDGTAYPYALGAEFGARRYPQFKAWRGPEGGYFVYPTIADNEQQIVDAYDDGMDDSIRKAGL